MPLFPIVTASPDGKTYTIVNELCRCGHFRTQHAGFEGPAALRGHGACAASVCSCGQFTWKACIYGGISEAADKALASIAPQMDGFGWHDKLVAELEDLQVDRDGLIAETERLKASLDKEEKASWGLKKYRLELEVRIGELAEKIAKMTTSLSAINIGNRRILLDE